MSRMRVAIALCGTVLAMAAGGAGAATCYMVLDAREAVVYRDAVPPVDLSTRGIAARDAMRQRGELLLILEMDSCTRLGTSGGWAPTGPNGDFLSGIRTLGGPYKGVVAGAPGIPAARPTEATPSGGSPGTAPGPAPGGAPGAAPRTPGS